MDDVEGVETDGEKDGVMVKTERQKYVQAYRIFRKLKSRPLTTANVLRSSVVKQVSRAAYDSFWAKAMAPYRNVLRQWGRERRTLAEQKGYLWREHEVQD